MTTSVARSSADAPPNGGPAHKRLPDFFIVGHPKCGTSALHQMLKQHPQIHMPVKEPRYFSPSKPARSEANAAKQPHTLEGYVALFAGARPDQRIGEATPSYLLSGSAASRIADVQPDARIIAIVREPVSFLRSYHLQAVQNHHEPERDFRKAIGVVERRRQAKDSPRGAWDNGRVDSQHVRYVEQLRRYYAVFPPEQVLVLIYEDFRSDNEATVRRVLRFLEVDDTQPVEAIDANPSVQMRSQGLDELMRTVSFARSPGARAISRMVKSLAPRKLRRAALGKIYRNIAQGAPLTQDESLTLELRHRFRGDVEALSEYLCRDLVTFWGYDRVG